MKGYYGKLGQVFTNLIANANQAVADNGHIRIQTRSEGSAAVIEIEDDGCGIPEEHLEQLFTPFFTTKPVGEGTGLGLSISHGVVSDHGGCIDVSSQVGVGTCFTIRIPIAESH